MVVMSMEGSVMAIEKEIILPQPITEGKVSLEEAIFKRQRKTLLSPYLAVLAIWRFP
jgi:hypothetical protein